MADCTGCPLLVATERTEFYPARTEYHCQGSRVGPRNVPAWIGFSPVTPEWCPTDEKEMAMAKKKTTTKKVAKTKDVPAPGQKELTGMEGERDGELDDACVKIAKAREAVVRAREAYDNARAEAGELLDKKERHCYTSAGIVVSLTEERKVKVSKAKDK